MGLVQKIALGMIARAERRLGVSLDHVRAIARTDTGLLRRYNRLFGYLDPNRHSPPLAHACARLRGALAADCGSCVQAEMAIAAKAGVPDSDIHAILSGDHTALPAPVAAVAALTDAVCARHEDAPDARAVIRDAYGEAGLIELSFAMTGAALLPGVKRALGHATSCELPVLAATGRA